MDNFVTRLKRSNQNSKKSFYIMWTTIVSCLASFGLIVYSVELGITNSWTVMLVNMVANAAVSFIFYGAALAIFTMGGKSGIVKHPLVYLFSALMFATATHYSINVLMIWFPIYLANAWVNSITVLISLVTFVWLVIEATHDRPAFRFVSDVIRSYVMQTPSLDTETAKSMLYLADVLDLLPKAGQ